MRALYELGGKAQRSQVLDKVYELISDRLNEIDRQPLASGKQQWLNAAVWERWALLKEGLLKKGSPRGVWEPTAKGIAAAERLVGQNHVAFDSRIIQQRQSMLGKVGNAGLTGVNRTFSPKSSPAHERWFCHQ